MRLGFSALDAQSCIPPISASGRVISKGETGDIIA